MAKELDKQLSHPLEREFEGWIINQIELDLDSKGVSYAIFAVPPDLEANFPADELSSFQGKVVGLQLKRPYLASNISDYSRLYWKFNSPEHQYLDIKNFNEIYYCLPTFINRDYRRKSLERCLFWRPAKSDYCFTGWYDNPRASGGQKKLNTAGMKWSDFYGKIKSCEIGIKIKKGGMKDYIQRRILQQQRDTFVKFTYLLCVSMKVE